MHRRRWQFNWRQHISAGMDVTVEELVSEGTLCIIEARYRVLVAALN